MVNLRHTETHSQGGPTDHGGERLCPSGHGLFKWPSFQCTWRSTGPIAGITSSEGGDLRGKPCYESTGGFYVPKYSVIMLRDNSEQQSQHDLWGDSLVFRDALLSWKAIQVLCQSPLTEKTKASGPHFSPPSEPNPSPFPCPSPPTFLQATGNPSCSPDFKQLLPLGQGVWEERSEATGQRSALFLPEVVRDLEKTEGGRVGSLTVTRHVCKFLCPSACTKSWLSPPSLGVNVCPWLAFSYLSTRRSAHCCLSVCA